MGKVRIAVFISLACNLLLATAYWAQISRRRPPPEAGVETKSSPLITTQALERKVTNTITVAVAAKSLGWRTVESEDYPKYIANLRSVGCPEKTIRDVIIADISELYRQRYRELFSPTNRIEYWKPGNPMANLFDETKLTKENALRQEKRELVRTLLGSACPDEEDLSAIQMDSFNERLIF